MVKSRTFSLFMVFVFLFTWLSTSIELSFAGNDRDVLIYEKRAEVIDHFKTSGFPIVETYESFFLSRVNTQQENFLKSNKVPFTFISGIGSLHFAGYDFKPDHQKNINYPQELRGKLGQYAPGDEALFILQYIGPVKSEWISELDPKQYKFFPLSDFSYLVKTTGNLADTLRQRREVSMIGYLPPSLKIAPELVSRGSATLTIEMVTSDDFNLDHFLNNHQIDKKDAHFSTIAHLGFLELRSQHTNRLGTFALHPRILGISQKDEAQFINAEAAQVVRIRKPDHTNLVPYTGLGQIVAVADTGLSTGDLDTVHQAFQPHADRIVDVIYYPSTGNPDWGDNSGQHGTHVAGTVLGDDGSSYKGMAPEAKLVVQSIKTPGGGLSFPSYLTLFDDAYTRGARIHNNSWGTFGPGANTYNSQSIAIDSYQWQNKNFSILFGSGNSGPGSGTISTQSNAKNNIVVGGTQNNKAGLNPNRVYTSSSRGPTADGRLKPDVVAPAQQVRSTVDTDTYGTKSGTSMATPVVAGSMALLREKYGNVSSALLKALLINGTVNFGLVDQGNTERICPNFIFGWGRVDVESSTSDNLLYWDVTGTNGLITGESITLNIDVYNEFEPFRATLVYTDAPGTQGAARALVNDLDLVVRDPDGRFFRGNQYNASGHSIINATLSDEHNNVEGIYIPSPLLGTYEVTIYAKSVTQGEAQTGRQPFALVASGGVEDPGPNPDPVNPSFMLEVSPENRELVQGDNTTYQATLTSIDGARGWVEMKDIQFAGGFGDPSNIGISYDYFPSNMIYLPPGMSVSLMIRINTSDNTPLSVYPMTAIAELSEVDHGLMGALDTFSMTVIQEETFLLGLRPAHARIYQDESTSTRITVQPRFGFNENVHFDVVGLPLDTSFTLDPNPTSSSVLNDYRSQLTIYTQRTTPVGIYDVFITGTAELASGKLIERTVLFRLEIMPRVSRHRVEIYRRSLPDSMQIPCKENERGDLVVKYRFQIRNIGNERLERNRIEIRLDPNLELISSEPSGFLTDGILQINVFDLVEPRDSRPGDCWPARDCRAIGYPGLSDNDGHYLVIYARLSPAATKVAGSTLMENRITFISDPHYTETFPFYTMLHPCPGAENPLYFRAYIENLNPDGTVNVNSEVRIRFKVEGGSGQYTYTWNWNDGTILNDQSLGEDEIILRHTYQKAGTYRVLIQARDSNGRFKKGEVILRVK